MFDTFTRTKTCVSMDVSNYQVRRTNSSFKIWSEKNSTFHMLYLQILEGCWDKS